MGNQTQIEPTIVCSKHGWAHNLKGHCPKCCKEGTCGLCFLDKEPAKPVVGAKTNGEDRDWNTRIEAAAKASKEWNEKSCAETHAKLTKQLNQSVTGETEKLNLDFPEECMYGEAKVLAKQMQVPLGLAYPALIGCYSVKPEANIMCGDVLLTVDVALIAKVGVEHGFVQAPDCEVALGIRRAVHQDRVSGAVQYICELFHDRQSLVRLTVYGLVRGENLVAQREQPVQVVLVHHVNLQLWRSRFAQPPR